MKRSRSGNWPGTHVVFCFYPRVIEQMVATIMHIYKRIYTQHQPTVVNMVLLVTTNRKAPPGAAVWAAGSRRRQGWYPGATVDAGKAWLWTWAVHPRASTLASSDPCFASPATKKLKLKLKLYYMCGMV